MAGVYNASNASEAATVRKHVGRYPVVVRIPPMRWSFAVVHVKTERKLVCSCWSARKSLRRDSVVGKRVTLTAYTIYGLIKLK